MDFDLLHLLIGTVWLGEQMFDSKLEFATPLGSSHVECAVLLCCFFLKINLTVENRNNICNNKSKQHKHTSTHTEVVHYNSLRNISFVGVLSSMVHGHSCLVARVAEKSFDWSILLYATSLLPHPSAPLQALCGILVWSRIMDICSFEYTVNSEACSSSTSCSRIENQTNTEFWRPRNQNFHFKSSELSLKNKDRLICLSTWTDNLSFNFSVQPLS